jgi:hypothetical protein
MFAKLFCYHRVLSSVFLFMAALEAGLGRFALDETLWGWQRHFHTHAL